VRPGLRWPIAVATEGSVVVTAGSRLVHPGRGHAEAEDQTRRRRRFGFVADGCEQLVDQLGAGSAELRCSTPAGRGREHQGGRSRLGKAFANDTCPSMTVSPSTTTSRDTYNYTPRVSSDPPVWTCHRGGRPLTEGQRDGDIPDGVVRSRYFDGPAAPYNGGGDRGRIPRREGPFMARNGKKLGSFAALGAGPWPETPRRNNRS